MAVVYLAEELKHARKVAIKVMRPELAAALGSERFVRGIEIAAQLNHPNILSLHDEIGDALNYAHERGLVHRDIKPENILFQAGHALVCDFGVARTASEAKERLTQIVTPPR